MTRRFTDQDRHVAFADITEDRIVERVEQTHSANRRRGQNPLTVGFIIKRHVARNDGHIERGAGGTDPFDRAHKLAHDLGLFGIAEVQVVSAGQRFGTL